MSQDTILRIGTRDSKLALWQARKVAALLKEAGIQSRLVPIKSEGDLNLVTPLYAMGVEGVFTRALDAHLLSNQIDIAVHSMKDVPTQLARGIIQCAVLKRADHRDLAVYKDGAIRTGLLAKTAREQQTLQGIVATGSVRRKAQLLNRFPKLQVAPLRGNVQTRLKKLEDSNWNAAIFATAGLDRINERPNHSVILDWMLPAPAQGVIMVVCREKDKAISKQMAVLNHWQSERCASIERDFLKALMGGCSTPIGALAELQDDQVVFKGNILSPDGVMKMDIECSASPEDAYGLGISAAKSLWEKGAQKILDAIRRNP